ncbi:MAG TPA: hypothetical protein VF116_01180 [Ktedonobacterales bacterium]
MATRRCPRCDAALTGRAAIHPRCVLARLRFVLGGTLLALLVIASGAIVAIHTLQ